MRNFRKDLSVKGLLSITRKVFDKVVDEVKTRSDMCIQDILMSAVAMFHLKSSSLLEFESISREEVRGANIRKLYLVQQVPSDTYMRERLDDVDPRYLRGAFTGIFTALQRGKVLERYKYLDDYYILSIDGTGYFSSNEIHCENCCEKHKRDGTIEYYHQMLGAVIVHPDEKQVIPLCPEPIMQKDGTTKNDCERNASKRFIEDFRREHPHLKVLVVEDGLASNAPHIRLLKENNMSFVLGAKPKDHKFLFEWVNTSDDVVEYEIKKDGKTHRFRFLNDVPLNDANFDLNVNFLEYTEISKKKGKEKEQHFSWVSDIPITKDNVYKLMRAGRSRWKIENETFNTLKNQGYNFEHNFGHGKKNLSTVFAFLMMLAFLIDQVQEIACKVYQQARDSFHAKKYFYEKIRLIFDGYLIESWDDLFEYIANRRKIVQTLPKVRDG